MKNSGLNLKTPIISTLFAAVSLFFFKGVAIGSGGVTVIPDGSLFVQIANFLIIIWALNVILYKPIRKMLIKRQEKIIGLEQNIEKLDQDVQEKDDAFVSGIKTARGKGLIEKEALLKEAAEEERKIIEEINQKAQANLAEIREKISKDAESVRSALQKEVDTFANAISEKILGRAV
jgi:F-type H+-transporting ATPase subunit b